MKKHFSRLVCVVLSLVMITSALPITSYASPTTWTQFASSDFTNAQWSDSSVTNTDDGVNIYQDTAVASVDSADNQIGWKAAEWYKPGSGYNALTPTVDSTGTHINNGYMYVSAYNGNVNPLNGLKSFKIDVEFQFTGDFSIAEVDRSVFLKISTHSGYVNDFYSEKPWYNEYFSQDGYGRTHINGSTKSPATSHEGGTYKLDTDNLAKNTDYHYIMYYEQGHFASYVTDASGNIVISYGSCRYTLDTSSITGLYLGNSDGAFYQNVCYKNIKLYSGDYDTPTKDVDTTKDKYLFTYFTGNSADGETLHMAVSDDGYNWEALNGNMPIWSAANNMPSTVTSYPDNSGIAASGHVRDPYAFQAQDGSYYVLATDLNTENGNNWGNNSKLMVWHLNSMDELADTEPWFIDTQSIMGATCGGSVSRAWAPEAIWDEEAGHYMLFWAVGYIGGHTVMYYTYTDDFKTFLTEPKQLIDTGNDNIDGNITFDGSTYYLWFKDETSKKIAYSTSPHANGPYSNPVTFTDSNYGDFEGPEVYRLYTTGGYMLMADHYSSKLSYFAVYNSTNPTDFENNNVSSMNLNYLSPRHGSVMNITTAEYEKLIVRYGKTTYDSTGIESGKTANDYLVARYFTNDDVTYDATGHGNTLTNSGVTMTNNYNGKVAANFAGTASDRTSSAAASTVNDSGNKNGAYASINTSSMLRGLNIDDGITFSWYGYATNANYGRFFDWSSMSDPGNVSWDDELGRGYSQLNTSYVYAAANMEFGANSLGTQTIADGYKGTSYKGAWHLYTYTISEGYVTFCVDGALLKYVYAKNGESIKTVGCPINNTAMNQAFFDNLISGNLYFGISSYAADDMLNGYISDFRIYNRALSYYDVDESIEELANATPGTNVADDVNASAVYYDPMEDMDIDDDGNNDKTAYTTTVDDPLGINGKVLNAANGVNSKYTYYGSTTDKSKGYTISMWYNPGAAINGETIFNIGEDHTNEGSRKYFEVLENGDLHYVWDADAAGDNYINATGVFGTNGLPLNKWSHIEIQIEPHGSWDNIYFYIDGKLTKKIDYYVSANAKTSGHSIHDYFKSDRGVFYGNSCGYWLNAADAYLDNFKIYNALYSAKSLYNLDCRDIANTLLPKALGDFETAMAKVKNSEFVYTNMSAAYKAYDRIRRYIEACKHGTVKENPDEILQLYNELENSIALMDEYTKPTDTVKGYAVTGKTAIAEKYTHNMLTQPTGVFTTKEQDGGTNDNANSRISSSDFVWLYTGITGDTPIAPYSSGFFKKSFNATEQHGAAMFVSNDVPMTFGGAGISTSDDTLWHQQSSSTDSGGNSSNVDWVYENYNYTYKMANETGKYGVDMSYNTWYNASGYARFTGSLDNFKTDTASDITYTSSDGTKYNYLISFIPTYTSFRYWYGWPKSGYTNSKNTAYFTSGTGTVQVINYSTVKSVLMDSQRRNILGNIADYTPESAKELLEAYDALTSQSYALTATADASELARTLKTKVDALEAVDLTKIEKKADYKTLYDVVDANTGFYEAAAGTDDSYGNVTIDNGDGTYTATDAIYTNSSWTAYKNAYNKIEEHVNSLNPFGEDNAFITDTATISRLQSNVTAAKAVLVEKADYSEPENAVASTSDNTATLVVGNGTSYLNQNYSYKTWLNFTNAYNTAKVWADKSTDYKNDTEKYKVTYDKNAYGPYIAYDKDGNIVTTDKQAENIDHYTYIGVFYMNDGDANPTEFEDGDYVKIGGVFTKLNKHRYYASAVDTSTQSARQTAIISDGQNVGVQKGNLAECADYDAYDSATNLLKYYDVGAFSDAYLASDSSVYKTVQKQGLNSAVVAYQNGVGSAAKQTVTTPAYTDVSSEDCTAYVNVGGTIWYNTSANQQTQLDAVTTNVLSALEDSTSANRRSCTVTFNVYSDDENTVYSTETTSHIYGETVTFNVPAGLNNYKWIVSYSDGTSQTIPAADSYNLSIQQDGTTTVSAYCSSEPVTGQVKVRVLNIYGNTVQEYNVNESTSVQLGKNTCVIGSTSVPADDYPYYTQSGWYINGTSVNDGTYTMSDYKDENGLVVLQPKYEKAGTTYNVSIDGTSVLSSTSQPLYYDTKATAVGQTGSYAIALLNADGTYSIVKYNSRTDTSYPFFTVGDMALYSVSKDTTTGTYTINGTTVTDSEMIRKLDAKLPYVSSVLQTSEKYTIYTQYTQYASGINQTTGVCGVVTEKGTLYTTDSTVGTDPDKFVIGGENVRFVSNKDATETCQYYLRFAKVPTDGTKVYTRAYVKYSYNPNVADTDTSFDQNTVVQSIDYGNICNN